MRQTYDYPLGVCGDELEYSLTCEAFELPFSADTTPIEWTVLLLQKENT